MQNNLVTPPPQPGNLSEVVGRVAWLKRLVIRHAYLGALLFLVYWLALLLGLGRFFGLLLLLTHIHLSVLSANLLGELLMAFVVALPISLLGWWSETGFTHSVSRRGIVICLLPFFLVCGPALLGLPVIINEAPLSIVVFAVLLALLVGFAEEGMFRGLILRCLLPKGIWPAVLLSALCFASVHLTNLLVGVSWGYVVEQLMLAFGSGVLFAAIRLRTGSIWPSIVLHMLRDVAGLILLGINPAIMNVTLSNVVLIVNGVFCVLFLLNAFVLLRPGQVRKLKVVYGLVPPPAPIPSPIPFNNAPQPYQPPLSYPDYTSPTTYGDQPWSEWPSSAPFDNGEH